MAQRKLVAVLRALRENDGRWASSYKLASMTGLSRSEVVQIIRYHLTGIVEVKAKKVRREWPHGTMEVNFYRLPKTS